MKIVQARPGDAETLTHIAHAAKRHWGYPESWIAAWREILTMRPDFIAGNIAWCATEERRVVGFYVLTTESDGLHLDHLWILPDAMRRGLGRALFQHAIEQAQAGGFDSIKIEADPNAAAFYERMGAKRMGTSRSTIEGEPRELPLLECRWVL
jgi:ribosomal protein S18 acetylase RimI-like enzyme